MKRRGFLIAGGLSPLMLYGCCCPQPRRPVEEWSSNNKSRAILAPTSFASKDLELAIDVHVHLFNATDVDVAGYIRGPIAHDQPPKFRKLLIASANIVQAIGQALAISCGEEMSNLKELLDNAAAQMVETGEWSVHEYIENDRVLHSEKVVNELIKKIPDTEFGKLLDEMEREYWIKRVKMTGESYKNIPISTSREKLLDAIHSGANLPDGTILKSQKSRNELQNLDPGELYSSSTLWCHRDTTTYWRISRRLHSRVRSVLMHACRRL